VRVCCDQDKDAKTGRGTATGIHEMLLAQLDCAEIANELRDHAVARQIEIRGPLKQPRRPDSPADPMGDEKRQHKKSFPRPSKVFGFSWRFDSCYLCSAQAMPSGPEPVDIRSATCSVLRSITATLLSPATAT
jgi:hypothetical protein